MSVELYLTYLLACIALALVPGPNVTLVIANGLRHGLSAAALNIAGAQLGLALIVSVVALGLSALMAAAGIWFEWIRWIGAVYLIWLGLRLVLAPVRGDEAGHRTRMPGGGFFWQGLVVVLSNPKVLLFYGAFIPQFVGGDTHRTLEFFILGLTFNVVAGVIDFIYALLAGRARTLISARRARLISRASGGLMIGGGIWLALARAR